jgi:cytidylate kinase
MSSSGAVRRPVVTVSAPYGAGGSVVGPALASRLGVPFVDRAVPTEVASRLDLSVAEAIERDDTAPHGIARVFAAFARVPAVGLGPVGSYGAPELTTDDQFVAETEKVIRGLASSGGGAVVLGRAGAIVLADEPGALHVRLTGPLEARLAQAAEMEGLDPGEALRRQRASDGARRAYVRTFYGRDPEDVSLYHLVLDSTRLSFDRCVDLIAAAVA